MGIFGRLFGKKEKSSQNEIAQAGGSLDHGRLVRLFERPPSFSMIAIPGEVSSEIREFLTMCKYLIRQTKSFSGPFAELYARIESPYGPNNTMVQKAWFSAAGHTVLVDPEMVLITQAAQLSEMARKAGGPVLAAIWERGSETVAMVEFGPEGISRETWYCQSQPTQEPTNGHPEIIDRPDNTGLIAALGKYGLGSEELFGNVKATVVELQE